MFADPCVAQPDYCGDNGHCYPDYMNGTAQCWCDFGFDGELCDKEIGNYGGNQGDKVTATKR